jgi:hypothetical protein
MGGGADSRCRSTNGVLFRNTFRVAGSIPDEVIGSFNLSNSSSHTMAQSLTEMSIRNLHGANRDQRLKFDNLAATCEPIV